MQTTNHAEEILAEVLSGSTDPRDQAAIGFLTMALEMRSFEPDSFECPGCKKHDALEPGVLCGDCRGRRDPLGLERMFDRRKLA